MLPAVVGLRPEKLLKECQSRHACARPKNTLLIASDPKEFPKIVEMIAQESRIGFDTETAFFDINNSRNKGTLALIQITLPSQGINILIDPVASVDAASKKITLHDLTPFKRVLESPDILKVAHSAGFDKQVMEESGILLQGIVDTQVLLKKLRPDIPQSSLRVAVKCVLGLELSKEQQTSAWHTRPLSEDQKMYAALDPEIALALYEALKKIEDASPPVTTLTPQDALIRLDTKMRELDQYIDLHAPWLRAIEKKEAIINEILRSRFHKTAPEYSGTEGKVSPGEPHKEIDLSLLKVEIVKRALPNQEALLDQVDGALECSLGKGKLMSALKPFQKSILGFSSEKAMERFLDTFRSVQGEREAEVAMKFSLKEGESPSIDDSLPTPVLLQMLRETIQERLLRTREELSELVVRRAEIRALEDHLKKVATTEQKECSETVGSVYLKKKNPIFNRALLIEGIKQMAPSEGECALLLSAIENATEKSLNRRALYEILERPENPWWEKLSFDEQESFMSAIQVKTGGWSPPRVYPYL